jgi:hypothetical protein
MHVRSFNEGPDDPNSLRGAALDPWSSVIRRSWAVSLYLAVRACRVHLIAKLMSEGSKEADLLKYTPVSRQR